jgi:formyltetrahydrofolate-dependent phosphoribosylglycinamide formyltransferase
MVKKNTCVFISGMGSNLEALIKNSRSYNFPVNIKLIISNNKNAKGLLLAKKYFIPFRVFNMKSYLAEAYILKELINKNISLICLAGYMKILSKEFIKNYKGKIINIHPSLLPKYKGINTFKRILKNREKITGCTVHYVNHKLDSGKIILKKSFKISQNDDEKSLKEKTQILEYKAFSEAIRKIYFRN